MGYAAHHEAIGSVLLACGHTIRLRPSHRPVPGKLIFCMRCNGYSHLPFPLKRDVDGRPVLGEWRWKCMTGKSCGGGQHGHGQSRSNALYAASRHSQNHPEHEVWLIDPHGRVTDRWGGSADDVGQPLWVNGVAIWRTGDREQRKAAAADPPPF